MFPLGNVPAMLRLLEKCAYKWVRVSYNPFWHRILFGKSKVHPQKVFKSGKMLLLRNHYNGFDNRITSYINETNHPYYIISAHPVMLSFTDGRPESWVNFEKFITHFANRSDVEFVRPMDVLADFGLA